MKRLSTRATTGLSGDVLLSITKLVEILNGSEQLAILAAGLIIAKDVVLTPEQAAQFTQFSVRTLEGYRVHGGGPVFVRTDDDHDDGRGKKRKKGGVRYFLSDLLAWLRSRRRTSTSSGCLKGVA